MLLRRIKIAPRAFLSFSVIALLMILLGIFSLVELKAIRGTAVELRENSMPSYAALGQINENILRIRIVSFRILVDREPEQLSVSIARAAELTAQLKKAKTQYETLLSSERERQQFARLEQALDAYYAVNDQLIRLSNEGRLDELSALLGTQYKAISDDLGAQFGALMKINAEAADESAALADQVYDRAITAVIGLIVFAALLTAVLALMLTRSIVKPLSEAVRVSETIAGGDLTEAFAVAGADEPATLLRAMQTMQQNLKGTIQSIASSSDQLASAAEELNAVTEDSSKGLHQQNNELEQAATAVNEMTAAVDEVARNAVATSEASRDSDRTAREGQRQVIKTVESINSLAENVTGTAAQVEQLADKIRSISGVLDVIRSIAEQTNLLALNAAIEAARAGEAGRGFAVVADEVRALAHRTQQSTREIESMIGGVQQGTNDAMAAMRNSNELAHGTLDVARAAGQALEEITQAISHITERNLVIASASEEQAQVAREVDRNLVNIRDLAVQTSAGAHQTNAASQDLSRLAIDLNGLVMRFKV
ncbi:methyl-accepting chemotaxis protein [Stutzerimonas stutzeri]|uniref:HAMP domain-containing protein n=1 Tax=Stutzerimonas stutzeri TaxID=316 RepID=A0A6I6LK11_STUST|nr:methyl-accepting chemotaxis protein [Stutzerimonas stutzeri]QGZ30924.1 HAMP domain-containing protein [Stutzerimonas stutzeri]